MSIDRTPKTWGAEELTSSDLNAEVKDLWTGLQAAWTSYTPSWTASSVNPAIGNGSITGGYMRVGKTIDFKIRIAIGSTTTTGTGNYRFSLPVAAAGGLNYPILCVGILRSAAGTRFHRAGYLNDAAEIALVSENGSLVQNDTPTTWADGAIFTIQGRYEAA